MFRVAIYLTQYPPSPNIHVNADYLNVIQKLHELRV